MTSSWGFGHGRCRSFSQLQINAYDSGAGAVLAYRASGLAPGLSIDASTGLITGTPSTSGTFPVTLTVSDGTGASDQVSFAWTVLVPGGGIANGSFESGLDGWSTTGAVTAKLSTVDNQRRSTGSS